MKTLEKIVDVLFFNKYGFADTTILTYAILITCLVFGIYYLIYEYKK